MDIFTRDEPPSSEEIISGQIPNIYPLNYFSNELLKKHNTKIKSLNPEIDITVGDGRMIIQSIKEIFN